MDDNPFDNIESAQEYLRLLAAEVESARADIRGDIIDAEQERAARRLDALHVVEYKLKQLRQQLDGSLRLLNDLRMLRRLLVTDAVIAVSQETEETV